MLDTDAFITKNCDGRTIREILQLLEQEGLTHDEAVKALQEWSKIHIAPDDVEIFPPRSNK